MTSQIAERECAAHFRGKSRAAQVMRTFADGPCDFGLRANGGRPRSARDEWVRRAKAFKEK